MNTAMLWLCLLLGHAAGVLKQAKNGKWSDSASWQPPGVPVALDDVTVPNGVRMLLDASTPRLGYILIEAGGALFFDNGLGAADSELLVQAETILVKGYLEMGRETTPLSRRVRVLLIANSPFPPRANDTDVSALFVPPYGKKMLAVVESGIWDAHGTGRSVMWTKLSSSVSAGATSIPLLVAVDWKVGDEIIVTSTDFSPEQTERRTIASISSDSKTVTLTQPLRFGHYGVAKDYAGFNVDMRAEVGVLTSNLIIEGDMVNSPTSTPEALIDSNNLTKYVQFGGHTVSVDLSFVRLEGIQFNHMGQGGRLARYPVHWHHRGDAPGQYIKRCSIHDSFSRSITVHDTSRLLIANTVSFNVYGHAIYLEDGTEELNQFLNNLVVTSLRVGTDSNDYVTGSWKFPQCGTPQPGVRLQYLDYQPSGFWITSANNTFIGNVAVGHDWGFWIRVNFVFAEPLYPGGCTVCCPPPGGGMSCTCTQFWNNRNHSERVINIASSGIVFIDNVAHSNTQGGWWAKENWQPPRTGVNVLDGFLTYKNLVGVDNYGISNLNFSRLIAVDNAGGAHIDWVRSDQCTFSNSLFIGESENHGNPESVTVTPTQGVGVQRTGTTTASLVFPTFNRSYSYGMSNLGQYCLRMGDTYHHLQDIVFVNCKPPSSQWSSLPYIDDFTGNNYLGSLTFHLKPSWAGPDREVSGLYFVNSAGITRMRGTRTDISNKADLTTPPYQLSNGATSHEYASGLFDVDGSLPCSVPGAWWISNTPSVVPPECEYRSSLNMFYCPPTIPSFSFRQLRLTSLRAYQNSEWCVGCFPTLTWECGKVIQPNDNTNYRRRYTVHTAKHYVVTMMQPGGSVEVTPGSLPNQIGMTFEVSRWDAFEGMDFVIHLPGLWSTSYYLRQDDGNVPLLVDAPAGSWESRSACGETWIRVTVKGYKDGPWPGPAPQSNYFPERGWEIHADKNTSVLNGVTCGNPWAFTATGCGANPVNNTNMNLCPARPPPASPRPWVLRPVVPNFPIPTSYVFPPPFSTPGSMTSSASFISASFAVATLFVVGV